eukprot:TRINITY_DN7846_c0_g1_i1.p1 TRINITY_DN7846_c0_g1~~TRINITY_DN7846_c0_g1_i1.p1  ORF type:complete len:266 (-),score=46.53 TRINITY_DN7846_c0_g1_i1:39-836(-)
MKSRIWQVQAHQNWVKTVMIKQLISSGDNVCQYFCNYGDDLGKWMRSSVSYLLGIEEERKLERARQNYYNKKCEFEGVFLACDISSESISNYTDCIERFDAVCCFTGLDYILNDEESISKLFENTANILKPGGLFIGIMNDSSEIWSQAQKSHQFSRPNIKSKFCSIQFENGEFKTIGCKYVFHLDGFRAMEHYAIHLPTFIRKAQEHGFAVLSMINCSEFYEDNRYHYADLLDQLGVYIPGRNSLVKDQKEIIDLYTTFVLKKL